MLRAIAIVAFAVSVAGCGIFPSGPDAPDQTVLFAGDVGLACLAVPPEHRAAAKAAAGCAEAALQNDVVNVADLGACVSAQSVPEQYKRNFALVFARVTARFGTGPTFPIDSTAAEAFKAFLATCTIALG